MPTTVPHLTDVVPFGKIVHIFKTCHKIWSTVPLYGLSFANKVTNTTMFVCKIRVHPCMCMFPSNGNIYKYMPCAVKCTYILYSPCYHTFSQNRTEHSRAEEQNRTEQKKTKTCYDLWSDLCIYLLPVSCITPEEINI
jgi:hypothetical protein